MHILFALPGLHRVERGAEVAFESIAQEIARNGRHKVTLMGSGQPIADRSYEFCHIPLIDRKRFERWPKFPFLRSEFMYEDLTFASGVALKGTLGADLTVTCSYPYTSLALRKPRATGARPAHIFVTQNGDWPAYRRTAEARFFGCEGLVCTNPIYFERNRERWFSALIPNGIDTKRFFPRPGDRSALNLPADSKVVLMVSALEPGKRVIEAMRAMAGVDNAFLLIAGDGPQREEVDQLASSILPGRFRRATFSRDEMPSLYRSADLFLHTKIEESFGNVYIEALSTGTPVIAHDDAVTRWIFEGRAALVDTNSISSLTSAIKKVLATPHLDYAENVEWAHKRFGWNEIGDQYEKFFSLVLNQRIKKS